MVNFAKKDWDTQFFRFNIGRIDFEGEAQADYQALKQLIFQCRTQGYKLLYCFSPIKLSNDALADICEIEGVDMSLVDVKTTYFIESHKPLPDQSENIVKEYNGDPSLLYPLAIQAGFKSRYNTDPKFPQQEFIRFYHKWMDNACNGTYSFKVLVINDKEKIVGFTDIQEDGDFLRTGLIAVDRDYRDRGYGRELLEATFSLAYEMRKKGILIATQEDNEGACRFYQRMGMEVVEKQYVYHIWFE